MRLCLRRALCNAAGRSVKDNLFVANVDHASFTAEHKNRPDDPLPSMIRDLRVFCEPVVHFLPSRAVCVSMGVSPPVRLWARAQYDVAIRKADADQRAAEERERQNSSRFYALANRYRTVAWDWLQLAVCSVLGGFGLMGLQLYLKVKHAGILLLVFVCFLLLSSR
jgi:hypothetical protein